MDTVILIQFNRGYHTIFCKYSVIYVFIHIPIRFIERVYILCNEI